MWRLPSGRRDADVAHEAGESIFLPAGRVLPLHATTSGPSRRRAVAGRAATGAVNGPRACVWDPPWSPQMIHPEDASASGWIEPPSEPVVEDAAQNIARARERSAMLRVVGEREHPTVPAPVHDVEGDDPVAVGQRAGRAAADVVFHVDLVAVLDTQLRRKEARD